MSFINFYSPNYGIKVMGFFTSLIDNEKLFILETEQPSEVK